MKELVQNAFQNGIRAIENDVASFKVRSSVFNYKGFPFPRAWAKLGTKEGMEPDDRYFVYEYVAGEGDTVVKKRRGVLRASHIVNNDSFSSGGTDPSRFVQTAGWGLGKGMLIQQEPDVGLGISLGWLGHGSDAQYLNAQLEMRISKALGLSPAWYLYGDAGINTGSGTTGQDEIEDLKVVHEDGDSATYETDIQVNGYGAGIRKEFYFMHHFQFAPYLGFRMENSRFTTDSLDQYVKDEIEGYGKTWTIDAGARVGINLTYWLKLTGSVGFSPLSYGAENTFFGKTPNPETDAEGALTIPVLREKEENPFYQERNDLKWSLMLRATF